MDLGKATLHAVVDASGARTGVDAANRAFDMLKRQGKQAAEGIGLSFSRLKDMLFSLKGALAGLGIGFLAKSFIDAAKEAENYEVRLRVLLGSTREGARAFEEMSKFAAKVPFEYREIMSSATTLAGVLKGGVDEIAQWMPLIGDLAAATGLSIEDTTGQVIRMLSAGASAADMFRERGILNMLGFTQGVKISLEETRQQLIKAWEEPTSKFRGATDQLSRTWTGTMSMLSDAWFQFRTSVMLDSGLMDWLIGFVNVLTEELNTAFNDNEDVAITFGNAVVTALEAGVGAVDVFVRSMGGVQAIFKSLELSANGFLQWFLETKRRITEFRLEIKEFFLAGQEATFGADPQTQREVNALRAELVQTEKELAEAQLDSKKITEELFESVRKLLEGETEYEAILEKIKKKLKENREEEEKVNKILDEKEKITAKLNLTTEATAEELAKMKENAEEAARWLEEQNQITERLISRYGGLIAAERERDALLKQLNDRREAGIITGDLYLEILKNINQEYADSKERIKKAGEGVDQIAEIYKEAARSIHGAFRDFFLDIFNDGQDAFSNLVDRIKDLFKRLLAEMAVLAIAQPIIVPIIQSLGGVLGVNSGSTNALLQSLGLFGGGGGGGGQGGVAGGLLGSGGFLQSVFGGEGFMTNVFGGEGFLSNVFGRNGLLFGEQGLFGGLINDGGIFGNFFGGNATSAAASDTIFSGGFEGGSSGAGGFNFGTAAAGIFGSIFGGAIGGTPDAQDAATAGAAIGSAFGPIGAIIGGVIGGLIGDSIGSPLDDFPGPSELVFGSAIDERGFRADAPGGVPPTFFGGEFTVRSGGAAFGEQVRPAVIDATTAFFQAIEGIFFNNPDVLNAIAQNLNGMSFPIDPGTGAPGTGNVAQGAFLQPVMDIILDQVNPVIADFVGALGRHMDLQLAGLGAGVFLEQIPNLERFFEEGPEGVLRSALDSLLGIFHRPRGTELPEGFDQEAYNERIQELLGRGLGVDTPEFEQAFESLNEEFGLVVERTAENFAQFVARVVPAMVTLADVSDQLGVVFGGTGEDFIRFANEMTLAAEGGLQEVQALWNSFYDNFLGNEEQIDIIRQAAHRQFQAALETLDLGESGAGLTLDNFRERFEEVLPTLTPEQILDWLRAGDALATFDARMRELGLILDEVVLRDAFADFEFQQLSIADKLRINTDNLEVLMEAFTGTISQQQELHTLVEDRYRLELEFLNTIDRVQNQINASLNRTIENLLLGGMDAEEQYEYFREQANALANELLRTTDPERIAEIVAEIDRLGNAAMGVLDEGQLAELRPELLEFFRQIQGLANENLGFAREHQREETERMGEIIGERIAEVNSSRDEAIIEKLDESIKASKAEIEASTASKAASEALFDVVMDLGANGIPVHVTINSFETNIN